MNRLSESVAAAAVVLVLCVTATGAPVAKRSVPLERVADALVADLSARRYETRDEAADLLRRLGKAATPSLKRAAASDKPEAKRVAQTILDDMALGIGPDWPATFVLQVRHHAMLDVAQREKLIAHIARALQENAVPFLLARLAAGDDTETAALAVLGAMRSRAAALRVIEELKDPRTAAQRRVLTLARARAGFDANGGGRVKVIKAGVDPGEYDVALKITYASDAEHLKSLKETLSRIDLTIAADVTGADIRLTDVPAFGLAYDQAKAEIKLQLHGKDVAEPVPFKLKGNLGDVAVTSLDGVTLFMIEKDNDIVRRRGRFEKDYLVTLDPGRDVALLTHHSVRINGRGYSWKALLKGLRFDFVPPAMDTVIAGLTRMGEPVEVRKRVTPEEPPLPDGAQIK